MKYFALTVPGLGRLLGAELAEALGTEAVGPVEHDGRSDVVPFTAASSGPPEPRLAEDLFVEIGSADGRVLPRLVARLWSPERYDTVVPLLGRLGPRPRFRVVTRVVSERGFQRTELRDALTAAVLRDRPRWRPADPAQVELWALQTRPDRVRLGVRLSDRRMRQRGGREVERPGALRPAVAASMVRLALEAAPPGLPLLDPCCGAGTIVAEALDVVRPAVGADISRGAVSAAADNLPPGTPLLVADAAALPFASGTFGAVVSNLPFGRQHRLPEPAPAGLGRVLAELRRVVAPGGAIVVLHPEDAPFERAAVRSRHAIRLLGLRTVIWVLAVREG
jgi:23S rRNA G2445 N2-methylase RlmL